MVFVTMLTLVFSLAVLFHDTGDQQDVTENRDTSLAILKTDPVGYPPPVSIESRSQVSHLFYVKKRVPGRIAALTGFSTGRMLFVTSFTPSVRECIPQVSILKRIGVRRI